MWPVSGFREHARETLNRNRSRVQTEHVTAEVRAWPSPDISFSRRVRLLVGARRIRAGIYHFPLSCRPEIGRIRAPVGCGSDKHHARSEDKGENR